MSLESELMEKIPANVKRFRYENSLLAVSKDNSGQVNFFIKDVTKKSHVHLFEKDGNAGWVFTKENSRENAKKHTRLAPPQEFLNALKEILISAFMEIERIDYFDTRFLGKKVTLCSIPKISLDKIKDRKAYFKQDVVIDRIIFDMIDTHQLGFGTIENDKGKETHLIFVRNGEIYALDLSKLNRFLRTLVKDPRLKFLKYCD